MTPHRLNARGTGVIEAVGTTPPLADQPNRSAAFFDVDGTLVATTIVHYYAYFRRQTMRPFYHKIWYVGFLARCLVYLILDKIDRSWFNRVFYRSYRGMNAAQIHSLTEQCYRTVIAPKRFAQGDQRTAQHLDHGRLVVLVTGSIDFLIAPLARELGATHVVAPSLVEANGRFTGELDGPPVGEHEKARRVTTFAREHDVDLSQSYAYGDSIADLPMLELVGHPVAVNPDSALAAQAKRRNWPMEKWTLKRQRLVEQASISLPVNPNHPRTPR